MSGDALSERLAPSEGPAKGPVPPRSLRLGEALTLTDEPLRGQVKVETIHRTVFLDPLGITRLREWLTGAQEDSQDAPELWTVTGIAQETGVENRTVYTWIERHGFPRPFAHPVGGAAVWEADRVKAWLLTSRPTVGRPPKAS